MTDDRLERNLIQQEAEGFDLEKNPWNLFYDWFCKDSSLHNKGVVLSAKLKAVMKANAQAAHPWFNPETTYTFFKNNCLVAGPLYDDFRICDLTQDGEVIFTIIPADPILEEKRGWESYGYRVVSHQAILWGRVNNFQEPLVQGKWPSVLDYFRKGRDPQALTKKMLEM